ncbi:Protein kinase domain-containing protein, partial [Trichostrongylus colubriformis]
TYQATFSATRRIRIPRRRSSGIYPPGFQVMRPRLVTATDTPPDQIEKNSPVYQYSKTSTYFEQCFSITRQLGKGSFGEALEVKSLEDGKRYAIKRALHTFESCGNRRRKLHEAIMHESIPSHPNIVRFEKAWEERGRLYIQTELCGSNLADYRRHFGILQENELYLILKDVL